jgi:hypothetical protein
MTFIMLAFRTLKPPLTRRGGMGKNKTRLIVSPKAAKRAA